MVVDKNSIFEYEFILKNEYNNPFLEIELDVEFTSPSLKRYIVPAFWKGGNIWAVRFTPTEVGEYSFKTKSKESSLDNITKSFRVQQSTISLNTLELSSNKEYILSNKEPFFWFSDTWWMALSGRLEFEKFKKLANIRKKQGFNTIQLVAGLMPDMDSFDKRAFSQGGYVWQDDFKEINPTFFEEAEKKIEYLYKEGFNIAIVGAWGYYLEKMGLLKMKKHWRYIIARWGVYSQIYILAGEASMPFYLSKSRDEESRNLKEKWSKILEYVKTIDPYNRLLTIHPIESSLREINNKELLDINLLQASHNSYESIKKGDTLLNESSKEKIPAIMDEINYEGILRDNHDGVIRLSFWRAILNSSKGFGYGANGVWQVNKENEPFGPSPHGAAWGDIAYNVAIEFKGAKDISKSIELLKEYKWWKLKRVNILTPIPPKDDIRAPIVASIDNRVYIAYFYNPIAPWDTHYTFTLQPNTKYEYYFFSPNTYNKSSPKEIVTNEVGEWQMVTPPSLDDWVLILLNRSNENRKSNLKPLYKKIINKIFKKNSYIYLKKRIFGV